MDIGGEDYSWGIVSQGRGLNNVCVGSRKNIALADIRSVLNALIPTYNTNFLIENITLQRSLNESTLQ